MNETPEWELGRRTRYFNGTLRKLRLERHLTQKELAKAVGVHYGRIGSYESLRVVPPKDLAIKIATVLGVSVEQVFPEYLTMLRNRVPASKDEYAEVSAQAIEEYTQNVLRLQAENDDPEKRYRDMERKRMMADAISKLTDREQKVIKMYFGLGGWKSHTSSEIGAEFSISSGRANQLVHKALNKLRKLGEVRDLATEEGIMPEYVIYATYGWPGFHVKEKYKLYEIDNPKNIILESGFRTEKEALTRVAEIMREYGSDWQKFQAREQK